MNHTHFRLTRHLVVGALLALGCCTGAQAFEITIDISPKMLNIGSRSSVVTVHTDIAYTRVYAHSVFLNGIPIASWKADDRGYLVAKFPSDAVKRLPGLRIDDDNDLILVGVTQVEREAFSGTDQLMVIDVDPAGR